MLFGGLGGGVGIITRSAGTEEALGTSSAEEVGRELVVVCNRSESSIGLKKGVGDRSFEVEFGELEDWLEPLEHWPEVLEDWLELLADWLEMFELREDGMRENPVPSALLPT